MNDFAELVQELIVELVWTRRFAIGCVEANGFLHNYFWCNFHAEVVLYILRWLVWKGSKRPLNEDRTEEVS